ncbi:hypothetical protein PR048_009236 [Dryococelus australis]|uniref:Uncharacterized protein n=1 Tax=Dryococelus australis TaxID=614101 RepID=A0ABQ9I0F0_9NEOP|nr:hypothetical protein PR048_009236 [Dryococelus australis]
MTFWPDTDLLQNVKWKKWENIESGNLTVVIKTSLMREIKINLSSFKCHVFVQKKQAEYYDEKKKRLQAGEAVQVDFAENYSLMRCKVHIGNIHSDDLTHTKESAWLFLKAVVSDFQKMHFDALLKHLHVFSDNYATQFI